MGNPEARETVTKGPGRLPVPNFGLSPERAARFLALSLQVFGGVSALAFFAVFMPFSWMAETHAWLGMGELPEAPVVDYLARATSALCFLYGVLLLLFATDVHRYAKAIAVQAYILLGLSLVGSAFGLASGMPAWWMVADFLACWSFGLGVVWLGCCCRR